MRIMIFVDLENFRQSLWSIDEQREPRYESFHFFLADYISKRFNWDKHNPRLIRCYVYTGEYTQSLINYIKSSMEHATDTNQKQKLTTYYEKFTKRKDAQDKLFNHMIGYPFLEVKMTPLKFDYYKGVIQKGVDVLLAVDLVLHAFQDNYDVAIIC